MATVTSLFIRSNGTLAGLASAIEKKLGIQFRAEQDDIGVRLVCNSLCITLVMFGEHGLEDDMGIDFSSYQYELDIEIDRQNVADDVCDLLQQNMTLLLFSKLRGQLSLECIAVANLQRVLAR